MPRFFVRDIPAGSEIELSPAEARHAVRSRRLRVGDPVTISNGKGQTYRCEIHRVEGGRVVVRVGPAETDAPRRTVVVASAIPKGKRLAWMIQKLAELGVTEFVPVAFQRSVVRWSAAKSARLEKIAVEAAKQSDRSDLMTIGAEITADELAGFAGPTFVALWGADKTLVEASKGAPFARIVIGPEGGFAPGEAELLGATPVSLGRTVLRVETAAVAAAAVLAQL
ncbi:MAG TPA: RsmE family RNA methyltransferase [Planctomycetota bacterium]